MERAAASHASLPAATHTRTVIRPVTNWSSGSFWVVASRGSPAAARISWPRWGPPGRLWYGVKHTAGDRQLGGALRCWSACCGTDGRGLRPVSQLCLVWADPRTRTVARCFKGHQQAACMGCDLSRSTTDHAAPWPEPLPGAATTLAAAAATTAAAATATTAAAAAATTAAAAAALADSDLTWIQKYLRCGSPSGNPSRALLQRAGKQSV